MGSKHHEALMTCAGALQLARIGSVDARLRDIDETPLIKTSNEHQGGVFIWMIFVC